MTYLLNAIICSAFFLAVYYVLLEKAKMPRFNRFYLILALAASFIIPAITFVSEVMVFPAFVEQQAVGLPVTESMPLDVQEAATASFNISSILKIVYLLVTFILLFRFAMNLYRLVSLAKKNKNISFPEYHLVLLNKEATPFSFFRFIFVYEKDYLDNKIEPEVIHHELSHVRQYHSVDVIFIELISAIVWFNPVFFLYRRAIQLNHEFLADDAVVARFGDPLKYQLLLLKKISEAAGNYRITSSLNYKITQKRLVMITNSLSKRYNVLRAFLLIPVAGTAVFLFSEKSIAQVPAEPLEEITANTITSTDTVPPKQRIEMRKASGIFPEKEFIGGTTNGISPAEMDEYKKLIDEDRKVDQKGNASASAPSDKNRSRMIALFSKMTRQQQAVQEVVFVNPPRLMTKNIPTENQFENFKDASKYGVWVDNKRITGTALSDYKHTDFAQFSISRLYGKAREGRSYAYQVNLTTQAAFERENDRIRQIKGPVVLNRFTREALK